MSVSSNVILFLSVQEQIGAARTYKYKLTGWGQEEVDIISLMKINNEKKEIGFFDCFCEDDFAEKFT